MKKTITTLALLNAGALAANAASILLNGSFEDTGTYTIVEDGANPAFGDAAAPANLVSWTLSGTSLGLANGDFGPDNGPPYFSGNGSDIPYQLPSDGSTYVTTLNDGTSSLSQLISGLTAGSFTVAFDTNHLSATNPAGALTVQLQIFDGVDGSATSIFNQTVDVGAQDASAGTAAGDVEGWVTNTFTTPVNYTGSDLFARFTIIDNKGGALLGLDNVQFTAVPEPSSTALLGLAGLGLILRRRR